MHDDKDFRKKEEGKKIKKGVWGGGGVGGVGEIAQYATKGTRKEEACNVIKYAICLKIT